MHRGILFLSILVCSVAAQSQAAHNPIGSLLKGKVTLEAEPGCRGCGKPDEWTPQKIFPLGTKVWVRATLTNHTRRNLVMTMDLHFYFKATDEQGKKLRFTDSHCLSACGCYRSEDGKVHRYGEPPFDPKAPSCMLMITAARLPELDIVKPGKSSEVFLEITGNYEIPEPGEYRVEISVGDLWLARERDVPTHCFLCKPNSIKGAKSLGGLSSQQISIRVSP